ncbi:MAG: hypothetical protein GXP49_08720 [Deltaproteobacteria bacterium]|nr:hypothetical protein [Deltaproteobacteria bacterium]
MLVGCRDEEACGQYESGEDFFADPDCNAELDCMDEPPDVVRSDSTQVEGKDSRPERPPGA